MRSQTVGSGNSGVAAVGSSGSASCFSWPPEPGTLSSAELRERPHRAAVQFAGLVVARQRPATANGVVFMLLEDELAQVNLIVLPQVYERFRAVVRSEPLLLVRGRYEHADRNRNVLVHELVSLAPLARSLTDGADVHEALPRAHHFGHR